ncbi:MAG TPA: shikimate kinase, partial [Acidimicrobiales bacterium]|nr:shikimate kinase [Acidimicrobiales bacterium]
MTQRVLLVGMMGAGKTTVGRELSRRLGWSYFDSDAMVEAHTGKTVPEIFEERGEAAFRAEESRALAEAVTSDGPAVVSVAGGAVLDPD